MKELALINFIKTNSLAKAIDKFKLSCKVYENKILLKYDQIESPMEFEETQDARGIILEKDTYVVMSLAFRKFFNSSEGNAARIDWSTARILEKLDGSLLTLYFDRFKNEWCVSTTGTAEAEGEVNNKFGTTFADLFWRTISRYKGKFYNVDLKKGVERTNYLNQFLNSDFCYAFEMTTPYNIVVKPHAESNVTLLTVRNVKTLEELSYQYLCSLGIEIDVPVVKAFDINADNAGHVIKTLEGMPYTEEGYVVVDANFNRVKIKNPAYVAVHHLKSKTSEHAIMEIVKTNEIEEFTATFPERRDEIFKLKENYDKLRHELHDTWEELKGRLPKNITKEEQKKYAMAVFEVLEKRKMKSHSGLYFGLKDGKISTIDEYLREYDNKKLYEIL